MEDTWFVFDFGLFKKQKAKKKKKKPNFIYKVKLKPRIMERGETYGEQGKRLGHSQYHILNTGSQGAEVLVSSGKSGVAGTVFTGKQPTRRAR